MNIKTTTLLAIRLMAVYALAASLTLFPSNLLSLLIATRQTGEGSIMMLVNSLLILVSTLIGPVFIWTIAPFLSKRISADGDHGCFSSLTKSDFLRLGLVLVGVLFLPTAIAEIFSYIYTTLTAPVVSGVLHQLEHNVSYQRAIVSSVVRLLVSLSLIFYPSQISQFLQKKMNIEPNKL